MPTSTPPSPTTKLAQQIARVVSQAPCAVIPFYGQVALAFKFNPKLRETMARLDRATRLGEIASRVCALHAAAAKEMQS